MLMSRAGKEMANVGRKNKTAGKWLGIPARLGSIELKLGERV